MNLLTRCASLFHSGVYIKAFILLYKMYSPNLFLQRHRRTGTTLSLTLIFMVSSTREIHLNMLPWARVIIAGGIRLGISYDIYGSMVIRDFTDSNLNDEF